MSTFSVILLAYNNLDNTTKPCLDSLFTASVQTDFHIVLVDNASQDDTRDYLASIDGQHDNLTIILNDSNLGYSGGNNVGIKAHEAEYYVLLNSDTVVTDGWLDRIQTFFEEHQDTGLAGPVTNCAGNEQTLCLDATEMTEAIRQGLDWCANNKGRYFFTDCLSFFCVAIRQEVFDSIGLLDESYGIGMFEDEDFCVRAEKSGFKLACLEDVFIYHKGSYSFDRIGDKLHDLFFSNLEKFQKTHAIAWKPRLNPARLAGLLSKDIMESNPEVFHTDRIQNKLRLLERTEDKTLESYRIWLDANLKSKQLEELEQLRRDQVQRLERDYDSKQQEVVNLWDKVHELQSWTEELTLQLNTANKNLHEIYSSWAWKGVAKYYKVRNTTPVIREAYKTLRHLRRHGFRETFTKIYYKLFAPLIRSLSAKQDLLQHFPFAGSMKNPKVSVILPVYNQADLLEESIESVLCQTYTNFELIIINDGSKDGVERIFDKYLDNPRVILLTQQNLKLPAALNNAFDYATGSFFTWTSADNIMLPSQLEVLVQELKDNPKTGLVFSDYIAIDDAGNPLQDPNFRPQNQDPHDMSVMRLPHEVTEANFHDSGDNFLGASFMYRKEVADLVGKYFTHTFGGEDYDYWLRIHNLFPLRHVREVLYKYRVHDNTLNAKAKELRLFDNIQALLNNDCERRAFLRQPLAIEQYNTGLSLSGSATANHKAVLFASGAASEIPESMPGNLSVCLLDTPLAEADKTVVQSADVIVPIQGDEPFFLDDIRYKTVNKEFTKCPELFMQILKSKLFDKLHIENMGFPKACPYSPRKLNIGFLADTMDKGGLEKVLYNLVLALPKNRFQAHVYISGDEIGYLGNCLKNIFHNVHLLRNDKELFSKLLDEHHIDFVNLHYSFFGLDVLNTKKIGTAYTAHNSYVWMDEAQALQRCASYRNIGSFICVSSQVASYFSRRFSIAPSKMRVIPNGFDITDFTAKAALTRQGLGLSDDDFVLLNIASVNGIKLQALTIKAVAQASRRNPKIKVIFLGNVLDKDYNNLVRSLARREHVEKNVLFLEYAPKDKVAALLDLADCLVLPSIIEGWSNAVMEAMYAEKPLILSDVGSARDVIENSDIGLIIPNAAGDIRDVHPEDIARIAKGTTFSNEQALVDAILEISGNPVQWREKGKLGKQKLLEKYTVDVMANEYARFFTESYYVLHKKALQEQLAHK